ncbi:hypothetical protein Dimus_012263 [Dionaea muscipula]
MSMAINEPIFSLNAILVRCCSIIVMLLFLILSDTREYLTMKAKNQITISVLPCPGELLVEEHHSNYGVPWAGGRDVFEFPAESTHLYPDAQVLEMGFGTLHVALLHCISSGS